MPCPRFWSVLLAALLPALAAAEGADRRDAAGDPLPRFALARLGTTRWRQHGSIIRLAYSPGGKMLACGIYDDGVCLLDATTGHTLRHLRAGERGGRPAFALSADGKRVAVLRGTAIHFFDAATGARRGVLELPHAIGQFALSPDGTHVLTLEYPDKAQLLKADGTVVANFPRHADTAAFGGGGRTLLLGDGSGVRVWDVKAGREVRRLEGEARLLAVSADGRTLAARGKGVIRLWDPATGKQKRTLSVPDDQIHARAGEVLTLSADGRTGALAGMGYLLAWDCKTGRERFRQTTGPWYTAVALSPDGRTLAWSVMYVPVIRRWDLDAGRELPSGPGHEHQAEAVAFSPDGKSLASGSGDHTVRVWKLADTLAPKGRPTSRTLPTGEKLMLTAGGRVAWSPDGKRLALPLSDNAACLRDAATGELVRALHGIRLCNCIAFSPDGKRVAVGDSRTDRTNNPRGRVLVWDTATGRLVQTLAGHDTGVHSLAFAPDGKRLASGSDGVRVWDLATGKVVHHFPGSRQLILPLAFAPDGRSLVAGGEEATVWDLATGEEVRLLDGEHGPVVGLALSPDGRLLATAGEGGPIRLWDFATGKERAKLTGHVGRVNALAFSPDGKTLASAGRDTTVLLWDVPAALREGGRRPPNRGELGRLWDELGKADAPAGHRAVWALVQQPDAAVGFLAEHLPRAAGTAEARRLARLIEKMDDDDFNVRQDALKELDRLGPAAVPSLRGALASKPNLEVRRRIERLLAKHGTRPVLVPAGDALRTARAIEVLERIGTPEARRVLGVLKDGPPSHASEDARAALERLSRRAGGKP